MGPHLRLAQGPQELNPALSITTVLELLNNFIRTRLTVKSRDCNTLLGHLAFLSHPLGLRNNVRCSSLAHWKARSGLTISGN